MIYVKRYDTERGEIIAMCDAELIGKVYGKGGKVLDLEKYSSFYMGELEKEDKIDIDVKRVYSANIVGERSVAIFIKKGVIGKGSVRKIGGIPFVHIYASI